MPGRILAVLLSVLAVGAARAEEAPLGRYQMVPLPARPGSFDNRVMILDTRDGHLWQWWEVPAVGGGLGGVNSGITYMGKVVPGSSAGDTVPVRRPSGLDHATPRN
jgi:hypothetical protein